MSDQPTRFTVYAVSRDCRTFTSDTGIPVAHRATRDEAVAEARRIDGDREYHPTRITERLETYPFEVVRVVWRCDG